MLRRIVVVSTVAFLCAIGAPVLATVATDDRPECERVAEWAALHAGTYPSNMSDLTQLPVSYRRAVFAARSAEEKAALWRDHVSSFLVDARLSTDQRKWLIALHGFLRSEVFSNRDKFADQVRLLEAQGRELFGMGKAREIMTELGPSTVTLPTRPAALLLVAADWVRHSVVSSANDLDARASCSCSQASDWCMWSPTGPTLRCFEAVPCVIVPESCGTFWMYDCDGNCNVE
jgi:hypothetical protein